jgi:hypothetical protein
MSLLINVEPPSLPPALATMVEVFNQNQNNFVSTIDFLKAGILSPAAGVAKLKKKGAIIVTELRTVTDSSGKQRKNVAHYKLVGWN